MKLYTAIICLTSALLAFSLPHQLPEKRALPRLGGFNIAGFDFGMDINGGYNGAYVNPLTASNPAKAQIDHFKSTGSNIYRSLSVGRPQREYALNAGAYVILDLHNYARWNGNIVGSSGGPSADQFANIWSQLATKYASQSKIIFGLMNEPHDLADIDGWAKALQAAVNAIRKAGATSQYVLLPGNDWTHAPTWINGGNNAILKVTDNGSSDTSKLLIDVHQYLDSDGSGTHTTCMTNNVDLMNNLATWLASNKRQAIVSETGAGSDSSCLTALFQQFDAIKKHSDTILGFTVWSAGAFDSSYELSAVPVNGQDNALVKAAVNPYLPGNGGGGSTPATTVSSSRSTSFAQSTSKTASSTRATSVMATPSQTTSTRTPTSVSTVRSASTTNTAATSSTASSPSSTSSTGNLRKFSGKLGGIAAPVVTAKGNQYLEGPNTFNFLNDALARSCDDQMNACGAYANSSSGRTAGITIQQCQAQQVSCYQTI